eukprot:TRINITY_DN6486_c0_g1_i1.p1 TRINITY_DN6486_c0_g1~~TRINITY_DN6486_c0_g1_i1.p1  ORF type:complete len:924 (+),score=204.33 TRINITY_DN6486_c0_g1_i1:1660-4431(+)
MSDDDYCDDFEDNAGEDPSSPSRSLRTSRSQSVASPVTSNTKAANSRKEEALSASATGADTEDGSEAADKQASGNFAGREDREQAKEENLHGSLEGGIDLDADAGDAGDGEEEPPTEPVTARGEESDDRQTTNTAIGAQQQPQQNPTNEEDNEPPTEPVTARTAPFEESNPIQKAGLKAHQTASAEEGVEENYEDDTELAGTVPTTARESPGEKQPPSPKNASPEGNDNQASLDNSKDNDLLISKSFAKSPSLEKSSGHPGDALDSPPATLPKPVISAHELVALAAPEPQKPEPQSPRPATQEEVYEEDIEEYAEDFDDTVPANSPKPPGSPQSARTLPVESPRAAEPEPKPSEEPPVAQQPAAQPAEATAAEPKEERVAEVVQAKGPKRRPSETAVAKPKPKPPSAEAPKPVGGRERSVPKRAAKPQEQQQPAESNVAQEKPAEPAPAAAPQPKRVKPKPKPGDANVAAKAEAPAEEQPVVPEAKPKPKAKPKRAASAEGKEPKTNKVEPASAITEPEMAMPLPKPKPRVPKRPKKEMTAPADEQEDKEKQQKGMKPNRDSTEPKPAPSPKPGTTGQPPEAMAVAGKPPRGAAKEPPPTVNPIEERRKRAEEVRKAQMDAQQKQREELRQRRDEAKQRREEQHRKEGEQRKQEEEEAEMRRLEEEAEAARQAKDEGDLKQEHEEAGDHQLGKRGGNRRSNQLALENPDHIKIERITPWHATVKWNKPQLPEGIGPVSYQLLISADAGRLWERVGVTPKRNWRLVGLYPNSLYHVTVTVYWDATLLGPYLKPPKRRKIVHFLTHPEVANPESGLMLGAPGYRLYSSPAAPEAAAAADPHFLPPLPPRPHSHPTPRGGATETTTTATNKAKHATSSNGHNRGAGAAAQVEPLPALVRSPPEPPGHSLFRQDSAEVGSEEERSDG